MGVGSGRTRVADLSFGLYGRSLHPDWFRVRAHQRYAQAGWEADVRIVEGGHLLQWACGPVRLAEVLAGPLEEPLPEEGRLFQSAVKQERSTSRKLSPTITYHGCFAVERVSPGIFAHLDAELNLEAHARRGLFHRGRGGHRFEAAPLSRLTVEAHPRRLSVHAFHTFPAERAIVRTQSLFEIQE
jgi:hypothetical protein